MKFRNRHAYDPIKSLNREEQRRKFGPPFLLLLVPSTIAVTIGAILRLDDQLSLFDQDREHLALLGWSCLAVGVVGITWIVKRIMW